MRLRLFKERCFKAKAIEDSVLPPPVGTVSEKNPVERTALSRHWLSISFLNLLTVVSAADEVIFSIKSEKTSLNTMLNQIFPECRHLRLNESFSIKRTASTTGK